MDNDEIIYLLALKEIKGIGPIRGRLLIDKLNGAENIFKAKKKELLAIDNIGEVHARAILEFKGFDLLQKEVDFIRKNNIQVCSIESDQYPLKLKRSVDAPLVLFYKGTDALLNSRVVSIIGTRNNTAYGQKICEQLIADLAPAKPLIVSGLAYGIDIIAHRAALKNGLDTIGVLAHGLDTIYPSLHKKTAQEMLEQGGLLTEFYPKTKPDRENFPSRNRIVAGMADAVVVVESGIKGGSMITAEIAFSYHKDIYCFPGKIDDKQSAGCLQLIKSLKASLITSGKDILKEMNWEEPVMEKPVQRTMFLNFSPEEKKVYELLAVDRQLQIDQIIGQTAMSSAQVAAILLQLEMQGVVRSMPGKRFELL